MTIRERILSRDCGLCQECQRNGRLTAISLSTCITDHVVPLSKGGSNDDDNLQSLCKACDEIKTNNDLGYSPRVTTGLDGWPMQPEAISVPVWKRHGYR